MKKRSKKYLNPFVIALMILALVLVLILGVRQTLIFSDGYTYVHREKVNTNSQLLDITFTTRTGADVQVFIKNINRGENEWDILPCPTNYIYREEGAMCDNGRYYCTTFGTKDCAEIGTISLNSVSNYISDSGEVIIKGVISREGGQFYDVVITGDNSTENDNIIDDIITDQDDTIQDNDTIIDEIKDTAKSKNIYIYFLPIGLLIIIFLIIGIIKRSKKRR